MNEPAVPRDGPLAHPEVRYEHTDVSFGSILFILIAAGVFAVVLHVVVMVFFIGCRDHQNRIKQSSFPLADAPSRALPQEPRLEQVDRLAGVETPDVYKREARRLERLDSYGSTPEQGFIHVPIDRAMKFLANKLPAKPEPSADQMRRAGGLLDAGEPNSGRVFRRRSR